MFSTWLLQAYRMRSSGQQLHCTIFAAANTRNDNVEEGGVKVREAPPQNSGFWVFLAASPPETPGKEYAGAASPPPRPRRMSVMDKPARGRW
jgi:hypothetical protein